MRVIVRDDGLTDSQTGATLVGYCGADFQGGLLGDVCGSFFVARTL